MLRIAGFGEHTIRRFNCQEIGKIYLRSIGAVREICEVLFHYHVPNRTTQKRAQNVRHKPAWRKQPYPASFWPTQWQLQGALCKMPDAASSAYPTSTNGFQLRVLCQIVHLFPTTKPDFRRESPAIYPVTLYAQTVVEARACICM